MIRQSILGKVSVRIEVANSLARALSTRLSDLVSSGRRKAGLYRWRVIRPFGLAYRYNEG